MLLTRKVSFTLFVRHYDHEEDVNVNMSILKWSDTNVALLYIPLTGGKLAALVESGATARETVREFIPLLANMYGVPVDALCFCLG